jgi:hypothetical protein
MEYMGDRERIQNKKGCLKDSGHPFLTKEWLFT